MNKFIRIYANNPNPITKFFNKIKDVSLFQRDYSKSIEWLEAMKKVPLYVKNIEIHSKNAEQLENLTDPNLHNTPINNLELTLGESLKISSKTIENLKAIYPNSITLDYGPIYKDKTASKVFFGNFTKFLSNLDQTSLEVYFEGDDHWIELVFRDVVFKFVESKGKCSYIRAKSVAILCRDKDFCWIK